MGTHTLLGSFLDVQDNRDALGGHRERYAQAVTTNPALPLVIGIEIANISDIEQFHKVLGTLRIGLTDGGRRIPSAGGQEASQAAGHGLGLRNSHEVRVGKHRLGFQEQDFHGGAVIGARVEEQAHAGGRGEHSPRGEDLDDRYARAALDGAQVGVRG